MCVDELGDWRKAQELEAENRRLREYVASLPSNWNEDSSLETWFPLTAEVLKRMEAENQRLREELVDSEKDDDENYAGYLREVKAREAAEAKLVKMREAGELLYAVMLLMRCSAELQEPPTAYECKKMGDAMQKWAALAE